MSKRTVGTIKDPNDPWGKRISIDAGITKFLNDGGKELGELLLLISRYEPQPKYTKMGVLKVLKRLKKTVGKRKNPEDRFPKYYLKDSALRDISIRANLYSLDSSKEILNNYQISGNMKKEEFMRELTIGIGVYTLFNYIQSFKLTSSKNSQEKNLEIRESWLRQTIPIHGISWTLERAIDAFMQNKKFGINISQDDEKLKILLELENNLKKVFPDEFGKCAKPLDKLDKRVADFKKRYS
jgi:hypothetical protein